MRIAAFFLTAAAWAQVVAPSIGVVVDSAGFARRVYGVAGNFTVGPPESAEAVPDSLPGAAVHADAAGLIVQRSDGSEARFALSGVTALRRMSAEWVQVTAGDAIYALRVEPHREALFLLPLPRPEVRRR